MSTQLLWDNVVAYSLQIGLLVGLAAFVPTILRLRLPAARLIYWHILLVACLLLPVIRPWRQAAVSGDIEVTTTIVAVVPATSRPAREFSTSQMALLLLAAGAVMRLGWLGLGLWRLGRYRRHSTPLRIRNGCQIFVSDEISSPVTFGARNPVILLPGGFPHLDPCMQEAILCHEMLHVERRDWLFTVTEELVRAVFWFHPAIWWLLGEIQLAREQAVDRQVVERTQARDEYVDALLTIAGATPQLDLAPAPLFLRKRHLKQRVVSILKEVRMSKTRLISGLAAGLGILAATCWLVTGTFPLAAAPQVVNDAPGISVEVGGAALMHRSPVAYPDSARTAGVQGTVAVEAVLDSSGNVSEARVVSGPQELRRAAQQSVLQWHFKPDAAGSTRLVSITFQVPAAQAGTAAGGPAVALPRQPRNELEGQLSAAPPRTDTPRKSAAGTAQPAASSTVGRTLKSINVVGLSDQAKSDLLARLPLREGDTLGSDSLARVLQAVTEFDSHLRLSSFATANSGDVALTISAPEAQPAGPDRIKIGGNVQQTKLVSQPHPIYPPDAKAARIQGLVQLSAVIGKDGAVQQLNVLSGHPLLVPAALEAVRQWVYQPTLLNGNPVEVITQIDVNFTLSQ
ncbi:MAG TPA: M56 family metallopeptidase [Bryobacteraceae bacterium]|jgi:TonB family protein